MRIDSSGQLGVGTTSPTKKLTVFGTGAGNATVQIEGEGGADPYINFLANNTQHWSAGIDDSDSDKFTIAKHSALGTNDYFVLDTSGRVGIGTTSPAQKLHVSGGNLKVDGVAGSSGNIEICDADNGTAGADSLTLTKSGFHGFIYNRDTDGYLALGAGGSTSHIRITQTGRVGIGTTNPSEKLQVEGNIRASGAYKIGGDTIAEQQSTTLYFGDRDDNDYDVNLSGFAETSSIHLTDGAIYMFGSSGGNSQFYFADNGHFHANNNITAYSTSVSSDLKLKDNISTIDNSLATIMALRGVDFTWKRDNKQAKGFIAQEVEEILPELVAEAPTLGTDDTHKTVDYQGVIPVLVEAIKELKAEIEELKKK
jgi:hypothetical protein